MDERVFERVVQVLRRVASGVNCQKENEDYAWTECALCHHGWPDHYPDCLSLVADQVLDELGVD